MDISKRHFVTMSYDLSTITVPKEMQQAHASLNRFQTRTHKPIQFLMDDAQLRNLLVNVWPKLNATVSLNPLVDKGAYDKYLMDLRVASIIDKKLMDFLKREAVEIFRHIETNKANLIKHLEHVKAKEEESRRRQDEAFLREKEQLLASLNLALTNIDVDLSKIFADCHSQIKFLQGRIENIQQQKRMVYHQVGQEVSKIFNDDAFKVNGKPIFEIDPSLPPEERKELETKLGEHFSEEVIPLHQELNEVDKQYARVVKERAKAEKALEDELKRQEDNPIDNMTDEEVVKELKQYDEKEEENLDEVLRNLEEEEKMLTEAEKHADMAEQEVDRQIGMQARVNQIATQALREAKQLSSPQTKEQREQVLKNRQSVVIKDIDKTERQRYEIERKRIELQKRKEILDAQVRSFEDKAAKHNIQAKILENKPYNFITWNARAMLANRRRKQIEKFENKIAKYSAEEHRLSNAKEHLMQKFTSTVGKLRGLFHHHKPDPDSDAQAALKVRDALNKHPKLAKKATAELDALDKAQQDCHSQIQQHIEHAKQAKNDADAFRSYVATQKQSLSGEATSPNAQNEKMYADIMSLSTKNKTEKSAKRANSISK